MKTLIQQGSYKKLAPRENDPSLVKILTDHEIYELKLKRNGTLKSTPVWVDHASPWIDSDGHTLCTKEMQIESRTWVRRVDGMWQEVESRVDKSEVAAIAIMHAQEAVYEAWRDLPAGKAEGERRLLKAETCLREALALVDPLGGR